MFERRLGDSTFPLGDVLFVGLAFGHDHADPQITSGMGRCSGALPRPMMAEIRDAYCAVGDAVRRHYHDGQHVGGIWATWLALGGSPDDKAMLYSTAYHDMIYVPAAPKGDNERASAQAFVTRAKSLGVEPSIIGEVVDIILATADHLSCTFERGNIFCDLDLAGFACDRDEYEDSTVRLRREFASVGEPQWNAGRKAFLTGLIASPRIFKSSFVPSWWEAKARENIQQDLQS